tara:strand:+ start:154 stop:438 length:285 start_codon:yes stop_codon:yes gene_type:complete
MEIIMKRIKLTISGWVQLVGFRYFVRRMAKKLGLTGYVKNLENKKVEVVAEGDDEKLKRLYKLCQKGPILAKVNDCKKVEKKFKGDFDSFEIEH